MRGYIQCGDCEQRYNFSDTATAKAAITLLVSHSVIHANIDLEPQAGSMDRWLLCNSQ